MATVEPKYIVPCPLKARIMEPEETSVTRQRFGKHNSAVTDTHATTEELLCAVFSVGPALTRWTGDLSGPHGMKISYLCWILNPASSVNQFVS
jgi:hypothetical protein